MLEIHPYDIIHIEKSFEFLMNTFRISFGLGKHLDDFALSEFKRQGLPRVRLTVSELNLAGLKFYEKNGWRALGPDPSRPLGITMERDL